MEKFIPMIKFCVYSGTSLRRTPSGPTQSSIIERVSSGQGFIIHYVGYIWDSVSVRYRGMRVFSKRGSTVFHTLRGTHGNVNISDVKFLYVKRLVTT